MNLVILEFLLNLGYLGYFITNSFLVIREILLYLGYLGYFGKNCLLGYLQKNENEHKHSDYHRHFHLMEENKAVEI